MHTVFILNLNCLYGVCIKRDFAAEGFQVGCSFACKQSILCVKPVAVNVVGLINLKEVFSRTVITHMTLVIILAKTDGVYSALVL